jgi:hypothetical protein
MILPNRPVLLIATTMSAIMLVGSSSPSLVPATAFAQRDGSIDARLGQLLNLNSNNENNIAENHLDHYSVIDHPTTIQQISVDTAVKFTNGNDVALLGGCADINDDDKVTQVSEQAANQVVHKNTDVEDGVLVVVDPTTIQQISVQTAANVNTDNDVYIVLGCHDGNVKISDNDKVTQVSEQAANQEALSDSDGPTIQQTSAQTAANHNEDNDRTVYIGSLNL